MSAEFFDILPPPQSIETLDNWGALDDLPYSLDDVIWQKVGVYGLRVEATAHSSEKQGGDSFVRGLELVGEAHGDGALTGFKVTYISGTGAASSSESAAYAVVRDVRGKATAQTFDAVSYIVIRDLRGKSVGWTGASGEGVKVSYLSGDAQAFSQEKLQANYTRSLSGLSGGTTRGSMTVGRVLLLAGMAHAQSSENIHPTYKGWNWNKETAAPAPEWEPEIIAPDAWEQIQENAAEWAAQGVVAQGWTRIHGGAAQWR